MSQPEKHWAAPQVLFDPLNPNTFKAHDESEADEESAISLEMRLSLESSLIALADDDDEITEAEPLAEEEYILDEEVADGEAALHARPARSSAFVPSFNLQNVVVACGLIVGCFALIWTRDLVSPSLEAQAKVHIAKQTAALQPANAPQPEAQQNSAPAPLAPVTQTLLPQTTTATPQEVTTEADEGRTETANSQTTESAAPAASNPIITTLPLTSPAPQTQPAINEPARIAAIPNRATASGNGGPFNPTAAFNPAPPPVEGEPLDAPAPPDNHQLQSSPLYLNPTNDANRPRRFPRRPPGTNGQPQGNGQTNSAPRRFPSQWPRPTRDGQNAVPPRQAPAQSGVSNPTGH